MWSLSDRDVPARRRETRIPSLQVLDVGGRCLLVCGRRVGVLHAAGVFCLVIRSRTSGRQAMTIRHTHIHTYTRVHAQVQRCVLLRWEDWRSRPPSLPVPFPRGKPPSFQFQQTAIRGLRCGQSLYASRRAEITKKSGGVVGWDGWMVHSSGWQRMAGGWSRVGSD